MFWRNSGRSRRPRAPRRDASWSGGAGLPDQGPGPECAGTAGDAARWGGSRAVVGMAANPRGSPPGRSTYGLPRVPVYRGTVRGGAPQSPPLALVNSRWRTIFQTGERRHARGHVCVNISLRPVVRVATNKKADSLRRDGTDTATAATVQPVGHFALRVGWTFAANIRSTSWMWRVQAQRQQQTYFLTLDFSR